MAEAIPATGSKASTKGSPSTGDAMAVLPVLAVVALSGVVLLVVDLRVRASRRRE